jgi:hypothetical protein
MCLMSGRRTVSKMDDGGWEGFVQVQQVHLQCVEIVGGW